jgi:hypothetical protein
MRSKLPSQLVVSEVSIPSTQAALILSANPYRRQVFLGFSGGQVALGPDSSVTLTTGVPRAGLPTGFNTTAELWGISDGTASVQVTEFLDPPVPDGLVASTIMVGGTPVMLAPHRPTRKLFQVLQTDGGVYYGTDDTVSATNSIPVSELGMTTLPVWAVGYQVLGDNFPVTLSFIETYDVED